MFQLRHSFLFLGRRCSRIWFCGSVGDGILGGRCGCLLLNHHGTHDGMQQVCRLRQ